MCWINALRSILEKYNTQCCNAQGKLETLCQNRTCLPIMSKNSDRECRSYSRTLNTKDLNCGLTCPHQPAEQYTQVTAFLDLSVVYGNNAAQSKLVRKFEDGLL